MSLRLAVLPHIPVHRTPTRAFSAYRSPVCVHVPSPSHPLESTRRSANFKPTIWHDTFIQSLQNGDQHEGRNMEKVNKLKQEVRQMIHKEELLRDKLELIDALQQLGVTYHFKDDVKSVLTCIHQSMDQMLLSTSGELHVIALLFRQLRMHGFSVSEDIFNSYIDTKGDFIIELSSDIKGMLSLYETSYLAKEGEETMEKAREFTTKHLKSYGESSNCNDSRLKEHVIHALELPLHWRMERLHTRWFIDEYKVDKQMRPALLELAVLDFNIIQTSYKKELKDLSSWWTDLRLYDKLPFIRDRLVENHLWSVAFTFEPKHASLRKVQTKAICLIAMFDDIYDVYGSLDELEAFTDAVGQWDLTAMEKLPEYMQMCFLALINTLNNSAYEVLKEKGLNIIPYLRRAWTDLCNAWLAEARWYHNGQSPKFEEYLENAWVSIASTIVLSNAYCINDDVTAKDLEQFLCGYPDIDRLKEALSEPVESILEAGSDNTWQSIRHLHKIETERAVSSFSDELSGFELDDTTRDAMILSLREVSRDIVHKKAREEASKVLIHMKERFSAVFSHDKDSMPRVWTGKENIRAITKEARTAALKLLSVLAAVRLEDKTDKIERILRSSLLDVGSSSMTRNIEGSTDPLASSTWDEISSKDTLITPVQCKAYWRHFNTETEYSVAQAITAQEAHKRNNSKLPPLWAVIVMFALGFNEIMAIITFILRSPFYLLGIFVVFFLSYAVALQYNIAGYFHHGLFSGILTLSARFLPMVLNILQRVANQGQQQYQNNQQYPQPNLPPIGTAQSFRHRNESQRHTAASSVVLEPASSTSSVSSNSAIDDASPSSRDRTGEELTS